MSRGIMLPGNGQSVERPMVLTTPFNDTQLLAMVAAQRWDYPPAKAVAWASELIVEAVMQCPAMVKTIGERKAAEQQT